MHGVSIRMQCFLDSAPQIKLDKSLAELTRESSSAQFMTEQEVYCDTILSGHPVIGHSMDYVDKNNKRVLSYLSWRNRDQTVSTTASHMLFCYDIWQTKIHIKKEDVVPDYCKESVDRSREKNPSSWIHDGIPVRTQK